MVSIPVLAMAEKQIDPISQLPDDIMIRILSLLPTKDVARTNLVTKAWRKLSSSLPVLMFKSSDFLRSRRKHTDVSSFINAIDSSLKLRQKDAILAKLLLHLELSDIKSPSLIDSWIDAALERKVKELDLYMLPRGTAIGMPYSLPSKIFGATTITVLSLQRVILEIWGDIDLPALRKLCLKGVQCYEHPIRKLMSSCPLIESLEIDSCHGLQKLHVSGLANLHRLKVLYCYELKRIEIDAPSLQYLKHHHGKCPCEVVLTACESLRELILYDSTITEDLFQNLVSGLPNLVKLEMCCSRLQRIEISHHQLRRLELTVPEKQSKAKFKIDTPNLQSFAYDGLRMPLTSIISSLNTSSLQEVEIHFSSRDNYNHFFIPQLKEFFENLKHCQVIKLLVKSKRELIFPRKLRPILSPPIYNIKHLNLRVYHRCRFQHIMDRVLWMCHPQTLSIPSGSSPKFLKILYNKFWNREEHPQCCTSCPIKCWRHYLEDVQVESRLEIDRIIAMPEPSMTFTKYEKPSIGFTKYEVRFRLKWRS